MLLLYCFKNMSSNYLRENYQDIIFRSMLINQSGRYNYAFIKKNH